MRTTVEIDDELREELVKISAERGEKGYSSLINEAIREFIDKRKNRESDLEKIRALRGSLEDEDAKEWEERIEQAWKNWEL